MFLRRAFRRLSTLHVHYGTQTGTASEFSAQLEDTLSREISGQGIAPNVLTHKAPHTSVSSLGSDPNEVREALKGMASRGDTLVLIASCYGRGEPTDDAAAFYYSLVGRGKLALGGAEKGAVGEGGVCLGELKEKEKDTVCLGEQGGTAAGGGNDAADVAPVFKEGELKGLKYAVFGLGSSITHKQHYNVVGIKIDDVLDKLGAERILPMGKGDDSGDIEDDFDTWLEEAVPVIIEATSSDPGSGGGSPGAGGDTDSAGETSEPSGAPSFASLAAAAASAREAALAVSSYGSDVIITEKRVEGFPSERPSMHMSVADILEDGSSGPLAYKTGDHIAFRPCQDEEIVEQVVAKFGADRCDDDILRALFEKTDLAGVPSVRMLRKLSDMAPTSSMREDFDALSRGPAYRDFKSSGMTVAELITSAYPTLDIDPVDFIAAAPEVQPRYYSISSSSWLDPGKVDILYRPFIWSDPRGTVHRGLATDWLAGREIGDHIPATLRESDFRLPQDTQVPVIMFAGGTGVAPFRGFLREREAIINAAGGDKSAVGDAIIFVGARCKKEIPYIKDLMRAEKCGAVRTVELVTGADVSAYPRAIAKNGERLWHMIDAQRGNVYVCGGASGFGRAMVAAITKVFADVGKVEDADAYFSDFLDNNRYLEDVADS